ncbi:hypothetical protein ACFL20_06565 [Spirochaetota bacterium]
MPQEKRIIIEQIDNCSHHGNNGYSNYNAFSDGMSSGMVDAKKICPIIMLIITILVISIIGIYC